MFDCKPSRRYVLNMKQKTRKKQPEHVKAKILESAGRIIASEGVDMITLDRVAREAGASKGGLLHHFPSRRALVDALFAEIFLRWDKEIARHMKDDPLEEGRFTRAYVLSSVVPFDGQFDTRIIGALALAMHVDENLRRQWNDWLEAYLGREGGNEQAVERRIARAAANGLWLAGHIGTAVTPLPEREEMVRVLLAMTRAGQ